MCVERQYFRVIRMMLTKSQYPQGLWRDQFWRAAAFLANLSTFLTAQRPFRHAVAYSAVFDYSFFKTIS